jgi:hypothetical protein
MAVRSRILPEQVLEERLPAERQAVIRVQMKMDESEKHPRDRIKWVR